MKYSFRIRAKLHYKLKGVEMVYGIRLESIMICEFNNTLQIVYILVNV
jgi:hypothetical protein